MPLQLDEPQLPLPPAAQALLNLPATGAAGAGAGLGGVPDLGPVDPSAFALPTLPATQTIGPSGGALQVPALPASAGAGGPIGAQGDSGFEQFVQLLLRAAPGLLAGIAARRHGLAGAGGVARGFASGLAQQQAEAFRRRALDLQERGLDEQGLQRAEAEKRRIRTAVSGILDRARDDASRFEGSPEAFAEWKAQVREQLDAYAAGELADTLRFPNERYLKAVAGEDRAWWDLAVKEHFDRLTSGKDEEVEAVLNLTRYSPVRGHSVTLKEAAATIGLADEEGRVRIPKRDRNISGYVRVPVPGKPRTFTYVPAEEAIGQEFTELPEPKEPREPARATDLVLKDGRLYRVFTESDGTQTEVPFDPGAERAAAPGEDEADRLINEALRRIREREGAATETPEERLNRILGGGSAPAPAR